MVLLDTGTPGTSREICSEDADDGTRIRSKAIAGKELSLSSWCIASLYVCHFSTVVLCPVEPLYFSDEKLTTVEK